MPYQLPHAVREDKALRILKRALLHSRNDWKTSLPSLAGVVGRLEDEIHFAVRRERILEALVPGLEEALRRKDLTAWVAVDDDTALLILDFLGRKGLRVPETVSLAGFDDTAEGARRDLTSYNFDFERFNHYVLRYLLEPARVEKAERKGARMPQGRVVARGSVRRNLVF
jgi:DNA-binding LacI/PurR family transcriptional regulator